ncbi:GGDEF domain-containing protein [Uliginosibacterium sp. H1]|uniref:GGDEF domain-containing protein n=1 Tax=Uliginosibacterium sp. H1 TaxID=3114757 RepID=UPI002E19C79F|nr:GGDEF domain-containing protein [Uliginosibacterium sp. H1]
MQADTLLHLLEHMDEMTASRDRERLAEHVASGGRELIDAQFALLHRVQITPQGYALTPAAWSVEGVGSSTADVDRLEAENESLSADPLLEECLATPEGFACEEYGSDIRLAFSVGGVGNAAAVFDARTPQMPDAGAMDCLRHFLRIYEQQLKMLDYAELDTLTRLNNRKTFDENFDRFISIAEQARRVKNGDRREDEDKTARPCWLGVVDIDKFKRINDNFGHLFGDEVLLRVAEIMKKTFRTSDKLFRFGGEEFVILLRHVSQDKAAMVFDRFRQAVEEYEFPQVGRVTCSLGYLQIDATLTPADMLGRADEALYFCKENGRNQIACYEDLVAQGLVDAPVETSNADLQADVDALFD